MVKTKSKSKGKPKLAFYWAASCGGCEITVVELGMRLVEASELVDIVFWPCIMDFKYSDVESLDDGEITACFFNGSIRSSENEHMAKLLRRKSQVMLSFGACSHMGGIPGLANFYDADSILERVYDTVPSLDSSRGTRPTPTIGAPGEIEIPTFYERVKSLAQAVDVDYLMPGCPPVADQVWKVLQELLSGQLPAKGAVVGAESKNNCDVCPRQKGGSRQRVKGFKRPHEVELDPHTCFLTQGVICCGPVTRAGCGLPCIRGNMPCRGCYGPPDGVLDPGAKLMGVIGALVDTDEPEKLKEILDTIVDPAGLSYRFGLANSILSELKYGPEPT
jgi:F420-non-reducing hydrogenase small subunit